jgi:hypothetical protein
LQVQGNIVGGSLGILDVKTSGLPTVLNAGSLISQSQFSLRSYSSGATDL